MGSGFEMAYGTPPLFMTSDAAPLGAEKPQLARLSMATAGWLRETAGGAAAGAAVDLEEIHCFIL